ncbi:MAG: hypothetical protein HYV60_08600 [Planctomycetia bacterium]|nr:hypothetical protein [Planctomycetia bacterium]
MLVFVSLIGTDPVQSSLMCDTSFATNPAPDAVVDAPSAKAAATRFSESTNFVVRSYLAQPRADEDARHCESLCCELHKTLLGEEEARVWQPKCEVVLHPSRGSYLQAVGRGGEQTVGSSAIRIKSGKVLHRRIDLLADDRSRALSALRHELIHVLFAELFPQAVPPRWAEEGLALLNDSDDKQVRHLNDLREAVETSTTIPLNRLFAAVDYPTGWQRAVFYGQSMSVVEYLTQLDAPDQFLRFVQLSLDAGHVHALRTVYKIDSLTRLLSLDTFTYANRLPSLQRRQVQIIDLLKELLWLRGDLLGAGRAADINDLPFHHGPLGVCRQLLFHDGANALRLGEVCVDGCPMLWVDLFAL